MTIGLNTETIIALAVTVLGWCSHFYSFWNSAQITSNLVVLIQSLDLFIVETCDCVKYISVDCRNFKNRLIDPRPFRQHNFSTLLYMLTLDDLCEIDNKNFISAESDNRITDYSVTNVHTHTSSERFISIFSVEFTRW